MVTWADVGVCMRHVFLYNRVSTDTQENTDKVAGLGSQGIQGVMGENHSG